MRRKSLLLTAAAFLAAAGNLFAQNWNMVITLSNGTKDTMAVKNVTDVTFFETAGSKDKAEEIGVQWIKLDAGTFNMGSPAGEDGADPDEVLHKVTLSKPFYISKYPITFEQYDKFCEATGREKPKDFNWGRGKRPVVDVSWNDAQAFCEWVAAALSPRLNGSTLAAQERQRRSLRAIISRRIKLTMTALRLTRIILKASTADAQLRSTN